MALFSVEGLTFSYPGAARPAVREVSLQVQPGEYLCLCGPSGCGKTTLLRHLKGALAPHGACAGTVLFDGRPLAQVPQREQAARIGFVMQDPDAQIVTDKVWHELAFGLESLGCDEAAMRLRVAEMASFFGMQEWFEKDVFELSGGQRQLLSLASAMALQPDALVLDEPTSQLDPVAAADFLAMLRKANRELGMAVIIAEQRLGEAFADADAVAAMDQGAIVGYGSPRQVARELCESGSALACSLPAPVRVRYGVGKAAAGKGELADPAEPGADDWPLTVREGRRWLSCWTETHPPGSRSLPEEPCPAATECALQVEGLWFRYGREGHDVLRGASLKAAPGQVLALLGGNGAGKSTLLGCACGILRPYRGRVRLLGRSLRAWGEGLHRDGVALLPQDPRTLLIGRTVRQELAEMLQDPGCDPAADAVALDEAAAACQLEGLLDSHPDDLSAGERQRVALAKVLMTRPRVLLLDEPTKGLDGPFKAQLGRILRELAVQGAAVVMASHDVEFCAQHAHQAALLFQGEVVTQAPPRRFFASNGFYTTEANRMSRHEFANAITDEDVISLCLG